MKENSLAQSKAVLVGNSDGIGLATTKRLLSAGWNILSVSRSQSPITNTACHYRVAGVSDNTYSDLMDELAIECQLDLCIYFVGIGELLDPLDMRGEARIIDAAVKHEHPQRGVTAAWGRDFPLLRHPQI